MKKVILIILIILFSLTSCSRNNVEEHVKKSGGIVLSIDKVIVGSDYGIIFHFGYDESKISIFSVMAYSENIVTMAYDRGKNEKSIGNVFLKISPVPKKIFKNEKLINY